MVKLVRKNFPAIWHYAWMQQIPRSLNQHFHKEKFYWIKLRGEWSGNKKNKMAILLRCIFNLSSPQHNGLERLVIDFFF